MQHAELLKHAWQLRVELLKILEGKDLGRNLAEDGSDAILLVVEISPETGNVRDLVAEIDIAGLFERLNLILRRYLVQHLLEIVVFERRMVHAMQFAIGPKHRVVARGKVQVRSLLLKHQIEESIDFRHMSTYRLDDSVAKF